MRVLLKENLIVLVPDTAEETAEIGAWTAAHDDHVFCLRATSGTAAELHDLPAVAFGRPACR